jgi:L-galactose dehydrogenase/L-glyceraldehyde 3-phosphate reductase
VELFQLHNPITEDGAGPGDLSAKQVLEEVIPAFNKLQQAGKTRFIGITAIGETSAVLKVISSGKIDSAQVSYNMLNPTAGGAMPLGYPAQDYGDMLNVAQLNGVGTIGIRADVAPKLSPLISRICSRYAPVGGGLQTVSG